MTLTNSNLLSKEDFELLNNQARLQRNDSAADRKRVLKRIHEWICKNENVIIRAISQDFAKPEFETLASEVFTVRAEIVHTLGHLKEWMALKKVSTPLALIGHRSWTQSENKGVVLIISPWNYPFMLAIGPLISALAAGNCVVIKPSELTKNTSAVINQLCNDCFSTAQVRCIQGDKNVTQALLLHNFNHVFFTGSTEVGKIIARACADRLIPVTLELGGKSPVIIDQSADIVDAAQKIFWAKFLNRGQTCVAPDYVFIHQSRKNEFMEHYRRVSQTNQNPARLISVAHEERLKKMTEFKWNTTEKTQLFEVDISEMKTHSLMQQEIFGPIFPLISYETESQLLDVLEFNQRPLTLAFFSKNMDFVKRVFNHFPSGSVTINALAVQVANPSLPFGGIGSSGMGSSHGLEGFKQFSHQRSFIKNSYFKSLHQLFRPPYTDFKLKFIRILMKLTA